ncbi:MAG TPA: ABC transporter substrate-binding protein [Xanthobacteraceae bacterium]|jgi:sulfonate transport system substrate-binding protein|nr:ABC transporter substrate-binding protein [Xanthobacteraceae bacterium]
MKRSYRRGVAAAALSVLAFSLLAVAPARAEEAPPKAIRLAGPGNAEGKPFGAGTLGVLKDKGYLDQEFKNDGVAIDWQFPRGTGPAINEAFANGQLDFASYGGLPNIVGRGAGLHTKVIAAYGTSPTYIVARNGSGIESIADLKGKKIALSRGTILQLSLASVLDRLGLSEKDVQIFDLITADQISAIQSGDVDAVVGTSSSLSIVERGFGKVIFTTKGKVDPASNFGSFIVADDFARKYPETTRHVLQAFLRAAYFSAQEDNRAELYDIWAKAGQSRASVALDYDGDSLRARAAPLLDEFYVANVKRGVKFAVDDKLIKSSFDVESWLDRDGLAAALKALGYDKYWQPHDAKGAPQG